MPSQSAAQHKLMEIAAHKKGGYGDVPQKVGKEFATADKVKSWKNAPKSSLAHRGNHAAKTKSRIGA